MCGHGKASIVAGVLLALAIPAAAAASFPGADGKIAYVCVKGGDTATRNPTEICSVRPGGSPARLTTNAVADLQPAYSANGRKIAFARARKPSTCPIAAQCSDIYVMRADGSGVDRLTKTGASETDPTWSPDGKKIAYVKNVISGNPKIVVMRASDGKTLDTVTTGIEPNWSPDGKRIAYAKLDHSWTDPSSGGTFAIGDYSIYTVSARGSGAVRLTRTNKYADGSPCPDPPEGCPETNGSPTWRPNGKQIAWDIYDSKLQKGYVDLMSAGGGTGTRVASGPGCPEDPSWAPDGSGLVFSDGPYCSSGGNPSSIYVTSTGGVTKVAAGYEPDWGPKP
jgi:TolB protein